METQDVTIQAVERGENLAAFRLLNEEWITKFFSLEEKDREVLNDPLAQILDKGGRIYMARLGTDEVGCVALIPMGNRVYELSKMAVSPRVQGMGIGRKLLEHSIAEARAMGAQSLFLGSNSRLENAIHLYEVMGFRHVPADELPAMGYSRANVFMDLKL
jgi:putative acetyltransferase